MILALPFPIFLLEVFCFFLFVSRFGFLNVMGLYFLPSLLGLVILSFQSRTVLLKLQRSVLEGRDPGRQLLSTAANFMGGLFLVIPTLTTRILALILLIPGLRQLCLMAIQAWLAKTIASGRARVFTGFPGGFRAEFRTGPQGGMGPQTERDVRDAKVIDVTPIEIEHSESKTPRDS